MKEKVVTEDIKKIFFEKIKRLDEPMIKNWKFNIYFEKSSKCKLPGKYIYSDRKGYHEDDIGERGGILSKKKYSSIGELMNSLIEYVSWECAYDFVEKNRFSGINTKEMFKNKQLELLKIFNEEYYDIKKGN